MRTEENFYVSKCNPSIEHLCRDCSCVGKRIVGIDVDELRYIYTQSAQPIDLNEHLLQIVKIEGVRAARIYLINKFCEFEALFYQKELGLRLLDRGPLMGWQSRRTVVLFKPKRCFNFPFL